MARPICFCGECGKVADLVLGSVIYPHLQRLHEQMFFLCPCGAYVGAHQGSGLPMGKPAGLTTRKARAAAHRALDRIWESGVMDRRAAYRWLAGELGIDPFHCHIGSFDAATASRVTRLAGKYWDSLDAAEIEKARSLKAESGSAPNGGRKKTYSPGRSTRMPRLRKAARDRSSRHCPG